MKRRALLILIYFYALLFSVLKTVRFPNDWAEGHWMLDYRFGFIKRGLAGEFFGFFFDKNEFSILLLSAVILLVLYLVLLIISVKKTDVLKDRLTYEVMFYTLFFLSQYIVFSAHLIGYFDHLIFLMTFAGIVLIKNNLIFLASVLMTFAVFIHEISFFLMLPICFFTLIAQEYKDEINILNHVFNLEMLKKSLIFLLLPSASLIFIAYFLEMNRVGSFQIFFNYLKGIQFISEGAADSISSAYTKEFSYYFIEESPHFFQRIFVSTCTIFNGIPILFMMFLIFKKFKKVNLILLLLLGICTVIPLALHAIAFDTYRIWSFPFMILFLGYWVLSTQFHDKIGNEQISVFTKVIFVLCCSLLFIYPNPLMDGETERFSIVTRIFILLPLFGLILLYVKKAPDRNLRFR